MIIKAKLVKDEFKKNNHRTPKGFIDALNLLVQCVVEKAAVNKKVSLTEVSEVAGRSQYHLMGRHVHEAVTQLQADGKLDQGLLMIRANEIKEEEAKGGEIRMAFANLTKGKAAEKADKKLKKGKKPEKVGTGKLPVDKTEKEPKE